MRAAILIRRSKDDRTETPEEVMAAACVAYCERSGYQVDPAVDLFTDVGETGGTIMNGAKVEMPFDRPAVKKLLAGLARYQAVCLYKYDRLGRDQLSIGMIPYIIMSNGVKVISPIDGDLDPDKPESKMMFNMKAFVAESERVGIRQRAMDSTRWMRDSGLIVGNGRPRYGYQYEATNGRKARAGRVRVIDPVTSLVVVRIFEALAAGRSLRSVAMELTADGIPTPMGRTDWSGIAISKIVRDPCYKGEAFQTDHHISLNVKARSKSGKSYTKRIDGNPKPVGDGTPPIVTAEVWAQANANVSKRYKPPITTLKNETWLRGRLWCANCGSRCYLEQRPSGDWIASCGNGKRGSKCFTSAKLELCESVAWRLLLKGASDPELIRSSLLLEPAGDDLSAAAIENTLAGLSRDLSGLEARKARILDRLEAEDDRDIIDDLRARQKSLNKEIDGNRRAADQLRRKAGEREARNAQAAATMDEISRHLTAIEGAGEDLKARLAAMTGLTVWVKFVEDRREVWAYCCPTGVTLEDLTAYQGPAPPHLLTSHVEPRGKGNYNRKRKAKE